MMCKCRELHSYMQPFLKMLLAVLLAHLLGDFPLQSSSMVRGKHQGIRALAHGAIHLLVLVLCVAVFISFQWLTSLWFWILAGLYIAVHLGIDRAKQGLVSAARLHHRRAGVVLDSTELDDFEIPVQLVCSDSRKSSPSGNCLRGRRFRGRISDSLLDS